MSDRKGRRMSEELNAVFLVTIFSLKQECGSAQPLENVCCSVMEAEAEVQAKAEVEAESEAMAHTSLLSSR